MFNISNFVSEIQTRGVLRTNRFEVNFGRPPLFVPDNTKQNTLRCESVQLPGVSFTSIDGPPRIGYGPIESMPFGVAFEDITLTFIVDARGDIHKFLYQWFNTIVNFNAEGQKKLKFGDSNSVVPGMNTYEVGYKDEYSTDIEITMFDTKNTEDGSGIKVMTAKAYRAFPKLLPNLDLAWGTTDEVVRLSIPFGYTDFNIKYHNAATGPNLNR